MTSSNRFLLYISLLAVSNSIFANEDQCVVPIYEPQRKQISEDDKRIYISSDDFQAEGSNHFTATGNISVQTATQFFEADKATYQKEENTVHAEHNIKYREGNIELHADELKLELNDNSGIANNTRYQLIEESARGKAQQIGFEQDVIELKNTTYTTCSDGEKQWQLKAESITLNQAENEGVAHNTRLEIMGTPILYLPYISFPLSGRKTGFLPPSPAYSSTDGFDISIPYYLNLAPNYDMTLTPRYIEKRGGQLSSEFRYLHDSFNTNLGYEILPGDNKTNSDRSFATASFEAKPLSNTQVSASVAHVSDAEYFHDLSTALNTINTTQISRQISSKTTGNGWQLNTLMQDFQILDGSQEPYRRLPKISLNTNQQLKGLVFDSYSEYSYFNRASDDKIQRAVFKPKLSLPIEKMAGFITPSFAIHATAYRTENVQTQHHKFANWLFRTDAGLFFERETSGGLQTLEPRIGYVYIPNKVQSSTPLIDSNVLEINGEQLFASNRYGGYDRLGGDNRITWALTSRMFNTQGNEKYHAEFAQAHYLQDLTAHVPGEKNIAAEDFISAARLSSQLTETLSTSTQAVKYSTEDHVHKASFALRYLNNQELFEAAYRIKNQRIEQLSAVGILNMSKSWRFAGRWLYSLKSEQTQEALLGLEYNDCCWSVRFLARGYNTNTDTEMKTSLGLQIELKGLAKFGNDVENRLSDEVLGNL